MELTRPLSEAPPVSAAPFLERASAALKEVFGFRDFRAGQLRALEAAGGGRDCLVVMPTGSGKSLCYQIPALCLPGTTLVVSPLIALMKDQVDALALRGVPVTFINSSISADEQWERLEAMRTGAYRLVYVAPERFRSRAFRRALADVEISLLAVDEAHCISEWGHDFRPDYRRLREVRERLAGVPALALTATATPDVQDDIIRELAMADPARVVTGFDRPNLHYRVEKVGGDARKNEALRRFIEEAIRRSEDGAPAGIVYAATRKHAEEVAALLDGAAWPGLGEPPRPLCRAYHAGLDDAARREAQEDFMEGRLPWVAATNAFGMGVDKSDIRFVIHYDLPGSIEAYYQEVGRGGRDGKPADCVLLFAESDRYLQEFFIEGSNPGREVIEAVHDFLWDLGENPIFRSLAALAEAFERAGRLPRRANPMAFRSAIAVLERAGSIERLDHFENLAEVAPSAGRGWDSNPYPERAPVKRSVWEALRRVFERSAGESAGIQLEHWAAELGLGIDALVRGLHHLAVEGWIRYTPPFRGRAIRLPEQRRPLEELGIDFDALERRRAQEERQLGRMIEFARARECRRRLILRHFGDSAPAERCGACDACRREAADPREVRDLDEDEFTVVRKVLSGAARARGRCGRKRLAQMLLGSRARPVADLGLDRLSTFGILAGLGGEAVEGIIDLLEEAGCLERTGDRYPVVLITDRGRKVMRAEERVRIPFPRALPAHATAAPEAEDEEAYDEDLFQRLRGLRRELAAELQVPAYRVFNDRTLKAMARLRPRDADALLGIPGVGRVTLERFGEAFLGEINRS